MIVRRKFEIKHRGPKGAETGYIDTDIARARIDIARLLWDILAYQYDRYDDQEPLKDAIITTVEDSDSTIYQVKHPAVEWITVW